jgi:L-seryl-tRNA(Ser) seleniumtransferase
MAGEDDPRRALPGIDTLLGDPRLAAFRDSIAPEFLTSILRSVVDEERQSVAAGRSPLSTQALADKAVRRANQLREPSLKRVINATGVILHTGLGRAPLSLAASQALQDASGYAALEFDLVTGERGDRQQHVESLLCLLTGAEAALVVNNNAGALYLALNALGYRREVVVSRGQLIEIGGSFRLPDIMVRSGVKLVEVGTTNRTRPGDYRAAITDKTALLLRAHPSNFRIEGFTESVAIEELVPIGRDHGLLVVDDLGSGVLWDWSPYGLPSEPTVLDSLTAGADLVLVSGDKALGGPQAGIILGRRQIVTRLKKNPLARVLRADKLILGALAATLCQFLKPDQVVNEVPVWRMMTQPLDLLRNRAESLLVRMGSLGKWQLLEVRDSKAEAGSGTLPAVALPSVAICGLPEGQTAAKWARRLRLGPIPVVTTVQRDIVWMDLRTVAEDDEHDLLDMIAFSLKRD